MTDGRGNVPDRRWREDLDAEIAFHIEMREAQNRARGMDEASARREAVERFGDVHRVREACREEHDRATWRALLFGGLGADVRQGFRQLRRSPVYALIAVLTLAFGIGTNVLHYGFMAPYFLRPLPFENAERLLHLYQVDAESGYPRE